MAYEVVESKSFSGAKGFWKPKKAGDELEGILIKASFPKSSSGFLVFELLADIKATVKDEKSGEVEDKLVKKGERVGVNYMTGLSACLDFAGSPCKITFKGKRKFGTQGHTVGDWICQVDRSKPKRNVPPITEADKAKLEKRSMSSNGSGDEVPF